MKISDLRTVQNEGILDKAHNVYLASKSGQQRTANAAVKSAESKFELNLATLIARAIQSKSIIQATAPVPRASEMPTANNPFAQEPPKPVGPTADNPFRPMPTAESKHYQIFDTLLEALIGGEAAQTLTWRFKQDAIAKIIDQYIESLVRQYKWADNSELKANAEKISKQIQNTLSTPESIKNISAAVQSKNTNSLINTIRSTINDEASQLFSTMYQWEQVGQTSGDSAQTTEYRNKLAALSNFLKKAAQDPEYMKSAEAKPFLQAMGILATQASEK